MLRVVASEEPRRSERTIAPIYMSQSHVRPARARERGEEPGLIERVGDRRVSELAGETGSARWETRGEETNEVFAYSLKSAGIARRDAMGLTLPRSRRIR